MERHNKNYNSGFSLTELSVVIVVISFIIAGVFKGNSLIAAAKLRAVIAESAELKIGINGFYAQYDQLPGDFDDATSFWSGSQNGDGDGLIEFVDNSVYEGYNAWQHMSYARILHDSYLGTRTTGIAQIRRDIPGSRLKAGGYFLDYNNFAFTNDNVIILGAPISLAGSAVTVNGALTPKEAHEIDTKADDGTPGGGNVHGRDGNASTAGTCVTSGLYNLSAEGLDCTLGFRISD